MSVIYNAKILLKSGYGNPGTVLDIAEAGYDISTNKLYIGTGIGNVPDGIIMDPSYNQLYQMVLDIESSVGDSATLPYVDGSLNNIRSIYIPDISLGNQFFWDASNYLNTQNLKGIIYPVSPSEGDIYYRTDNGLQFIYDSSRGKYLSTSRQTFNGGRTTAAAGTTVYLRVGDATQSSASGFKMFRNGTITAFSVNNNNTLTSPRIMQVRINNSVVFTSQIDSGQKSTYINQSNIDFNIGDIIQVSALAGLTGSALSNWIAIVEVAWRS